jgi:hypothetical protein
MGYLRTALTTGEALQVQYQPVVAPTGSLSHARGQIPPVSGN